MNKNFTSKVGICFVFLGSFANVFCELPAPAAGVADAHDSRGGERRMDGRDGHDRDEVPRACPACVKENKTDTSKWTLPNWDEKVGKSPFCEKHRCPNMIRCSRNVGHKNSCRAGSPMKMKGRRGGFGGGEEHRGFGREGREDQRGGQRGGDRDQDRGGDRGGDRWSKGKKQSGGTAASSPVAPSQATTLPSVVVPVAPVAMPSVAVPAVDSSAMVASPVMPV